MLSSPLASAAVPAAPIFSSYPPFTGAHSTAWNAINAVDCGGFQQVSSNVPMNLSTGQFAMALNGSAYPCNGQSESSGYATAYLRFSSPKFTLHSNGIHVLTTNWFLNVTANATGHNLQSSSAPVKDIVADYSIHFRVALIDLTPFGKSSYGNYWSRANITGNGSVTLNISSVRTMPMIVVLTKGDLYKVVITLTATFEAQVFNEQVAPNTAYAGVTFAPGGHPSVFQGFTIG
jgi:hypothetical protein